MSLTRWTSFLGACAVALSVPAAAQAQEDPPEAEPEMPAPELDAPYPSRSHFAFKLRSGGAVERLAGANLYGGYGGVAFGADTRAGGFFGAIGAGGGRTEGGLHFQEFCLGVDLEWPIDIIRLGLRPRIGWIGVDRVTADEKMEAFRGGLGGLFAVDFLRSDGWIVSLDLEPRIDAVASASRLFEDDPTYAVFGVRGGLTLRFRAPRE